MFPQCLLCCLKGGAFERKVVNWEQRNMCDEITEQENDVWFQKNKIARRDIAKTGLGVAALSLAPACTTYASEGASDTKASATAAISSRTVTIKTADGTADAFFVYPSSGKYPAVIMWPDIAGLRDAYKTMATRLAESGYAVLVVNQYYRSAPAPIMSTMAEWRTEAGQAKLKPMLAARTNEGVTRDGAAFVDWLDQQKEVDTSKKIGSCGYCQGGAATIRTAAIRPARVGAVASFHGGGLATDEADSPHLLFPTMRAAMLLAIAQNDDERDPEAKSKLRTAADATGRTAEIEVYPAQHGWCTIDAPVYDQAQAERAWARMLQLYKTNL